MQAMLDRPVQETQVNQIVQALRILPPEEVAEVWGFVSCLQDRYLAARPVDTSDAWSDPDLYDLRMASLAYVQSAFRDWQAVQRCS